MAAGHVSENGLLGTFRTHDGNATENVTQNHNFI